MNRNAIIEQFFNKFFSDINDQWVRGELGKQETGVVIKPNELHDAILDSYTHVYKKKIVRFEQGNNIEGETPWPTPEALQERGVFDKATEAAMAAADAYVTAKRYIRDPGIAPGDIGFWTRRLDRTFFRTFKTAAVEVLDKEIKQWNNSDIGVSTVSSLVDQHGLSKAERMNEDWQLRRGIQITHQGFTTTGGAVGAIALQGLDKIIKKSGKDIRIPKQDISQLFHRLVGTYETEAIGEFFQIALLKGKKVDVRAGSFLINAKKTEAADLSVYKEEFINTLQKLLANLSDKELEGLFGNSEEQIARNVGALVTKSIASQLSSKQVTQRTDLIKWAKAQKVSTVRGIRPTKYAKDKTSRKKAQRILSTRREDEAFRDLASVRAERLYMALKVNLREVIARNMGPVGSPPNRAGPLVYRTGRFADNVRIESVRLGKDALPILRYNYLKAPYQVFEPGHRLGELNDNHPWDPYKLINKSVREIAREIEITKMRIPRIP